MKEKETNYLEPIRYLLREELERKCLKNPTYSLRAFARHLEISPSYLSALLSGKRKLKPESRVQILGKLTIQPSDVISLNEQHHSSYSTMSADTFCIISDWYHYAILELTYLKDFEFTLENIANKLDISLHIVGPALERLKKLKLLVFEEGHWRDNTSLLLKYEESVESESAAKKYQSQILDKSKSALEDLPRKNRHHSSTMMSFNKENLEKANQLINKFRKDFTELLMDPSTADSVYQLQVSLFPITKDKK